MKCWRVTGVIVAGVACALVLPACGGRGARPAASPSPRSGVLGLVVTIGGPNVPADQSQSPAPEGFSLAPWEHPSAGVLVRVVSLDGTQVSAVRSDKHGLFRVPLAPGRYVLWLFSAGRGSAPHQKVIVQAGVITRAKLQIPIF